MIPLWMFPMATAAGNAMVLKPSERDPGAAMILAQLAMEAGGWGQWLGGGGLFFRCNCIRFKSLRVLHRCLLWFAKWMAGKGWHFWASFEGAILG